MVSPARIGSSTFTARPAASSPRVERRAVSVETSARNSSLADLDRRDAHARRPHIDPPGRELARTPWARCTQSVRPSAAIDAAHFA